MHSYVGDAVTARIEVVAVKETKGIVSFATTCCDRCGDVVVEGSATVLVPKDTETAASSETL